MEYVIQNVCFFQSYLSNRKQVVKCGKTLSDVKLIDTGIPQGSVLGPILFMLFVNDISQNVHIGSINLYADDCLVYCTGSTVIDVNEKLQKCIDDASSWYTGNKLVLNVEKSNTMLITSKHKHQTLNTNVNIELYGSSLQQVQCTKYLGVTLEQSLSWDTHINDLCSNLSRKVGLLSRLRKCTPQYVLIKIYWHCIQPTIDYALSVWGNTTTKNLNKIQRIQNYASRIITAILITSTQGV